MVLPDNSRQHPGLDARSIWAALRAAVGGTSWCGAPAWRTLSTNARGANRRSSSATSYLFPLAPRTFALSLQAAL